MVTTREELLIRATVENRASREFRAIRQEVGVLEREVNQGLGNVERRVGVVDRAALGLARSFTALTAGVSVGFALQRGVRDALDFSTAIGEVSTISNATEAQLGRLEGQVLGLAEAHGQASTAVTRGLYQTISAGVTDSTDALTVLTEAQELATAGLAETGSTVDLLTTAINAYGLGVEEAERASDTFFTGVRVGKTTVDELAGSLGQVLPIAASLRVPLEDIVGLVAAITARGVSTSEAVTQIRAALVALLKNGEDVNAVLGRVGQSFDDTTLRTRGLVDVLQGIREATGGSESALTQLFGRVEATNAVLNVTGDNLEGVRATLDEVRDSAGATAEALDKIQSTDGARVRRFLNTIGLRLQQVGENIISIPLALGDAFSAVSRELDLALSGLLNFELPGFGSTREEIEQIRREVERLTRERDNLNEAAGAGAGEGFDIEPIIFRAEGSNVERRSVAIRFELEDLPTGVGRILEGEDIRINIPVGFEASDFAELANRAREIGNNLFEERDFSAERFASALSAQIRDGITGLEFDGQVDPLVTELDNGLQKTVVGFREALLEDGVITVTPVITQTTRQEREEIAAAAAPRETVRSVTIGSEGGLNFQEIEQASVEVAETVQSLNEQIFARLEEQQSRSAQAIEQLGRRTLTTYDRERAALEDITRTIERQLATEFRAGEVSVAIARQRQEDLTKAREGILENIRLREQEANARANPVDAIPFEPQLTTEVQEISPGRFGFREVGVTSAQAAEDVAELNSALFETIDAREQLEQFRSSLDGDGALSQAEARRQQAEAIRQSIRDEADALRLTVAERASAREITAAQAIDEQNVIDAVEEQLILQSRLNQGNEEAKRSIDARNAANRVQEGLLERLLDGTDREILALENATERQRERLLLQAERGELDQDIVDNLVREGGLLDDVLDKERERLKLRQEQNKLQTDRRAVLEGDSLTDGLQVGIEDSVNDRTQGRIGARAGANLVTGFEDSVRSFADALASGENAVEAFGKGLLDTAQQVFLDIATQSASAALFGFAQGGRPGAETRIRYYADGGFGRTTPDPRDTVLALMRPKEFVLRPEATRNAPTGSLERFNQTGDFGAFVGEVSRGTGAASRGGGGGTAISLSPTNTVTIPISINSSGGSGPGGGLFASSTEEAQFMRRVEQSVERGIRGANADLVSAVRQAASGRPS